LVESIKELRKICQEGASPGPYRVVSIYITKFLLYTPITANQTTVLYIVIGLIAAVLFASGNYWWSLAAAILAIISYILDYVDGEIARYRKHSSTGGMFLDLLAHSTINPSIIAGISLGIYRNYQDSRIFLFGFIASVSIGLFFNIISNKYFILTTKLREERNSAKKVKKWNVKNKAYWFFNLFNFWYTPGICHLILIFSILDMLQIAIFFYAITTPIWIIYIIYRNIKLLDRE